MHKDKQQWREYVKGYYSDPDHRAAKIANAKKHKKETLRRNREFLMEYKKDCKCALCPESHPACLEFHHKDRTTKFRAVSDMVTQGYGLEKIKEEIGKCEVLCKNCHAKTHYNEGV